MSDDDEQWLDRKQTASEVAFAPQTLANWAARGEGPPYILVNGRARYSRKDVLDWKRAYEKTKTKTSS